MTVDNFDQAWFLASQSPRDIPIRCDDSDLIVKNASISRRRERFAWYDKRHRSFLTNIDGTFVPPEVRIKCENFESELVERYGTTTRTFRKRVINQMGNVLLDAINFPSG